MNREFGIISKSLMLAILMAPHWGLAEEGVEVTFQEGQVQTCGGVIVARGIGRPPRARGKAQGRLLAERAAKLKAYRNLLRAVDRLNPVLMNGTGIVAQTGFVRGAKFIERQYRPNGEVEVKAVLDVSFANETVPCTAWIEKKVSQTGFSAVILDEQSQEITEKDWIELNS